MFSKHSKTTITARCCSKAGNSMALLYEALFVVGRRLLPPGFVTTIEEDVAAGKLKELVCAGYCTCPNSSYYN